MKALHMRDSTEVRAEIVGHVQYRQGDGVLLAIRPGHVSIEVCPCDAVFSWAEDDVRCNTAMPFPDFHRYVAEGAIRLSMPPMETSLHDPEQTMSQRLDYYKASREATSAMVSLEKSVAQFGLERSLLELVRLRASQINGCAYCVDHHTTEARKAGESDRRLHLVVVWRESPFFTLRERAALAWTESLTRLADSQAPDEDYALVREQFSDKEIVDLTVAIIAVNGWNRLAVGFRRGPEN
jgi:AhpD family alkylhydroperoxidase